MIGLLVWVLHTGWGEFSVPQFPHSPAATPGDSTVSLAASRVSGEPGEGGRGGLYLPSTDEELKVCSVSLFQVMKRPVAAPGHSRSVPRVVGMSEVDAVLG